MVQCKNKEVNRVIADANLRRQNNEWSLEGKGRLEFVNDLRAEDAIYHGDCNSRFSSGKREPGVDIAVSSRKRGRPIISEREEAFEEIVEYLCQNDDKQITISKLNDMMKEKVLVKLCFVRASFSKSLIRKLTAALMQPSFIGSTTAPSKQKNKFRKD